MLILPDSSVPSLCLCASAFQHFFAFAHLLDLRKGLPNSSLHCLLAKNQRVTLQTWFDVADACKHMVLNASNIEFRRSSPFGAVHPAGSAVIEPMCGEDATAYFAMAHSMEALGGLPKKGSCDNRAEQAFTEQNILDGAALVSYIILPMFFNEVILAATSPAAQDRLLRRPMAKPFKSKCLGNFLNSYVEMPLGVFFMVVWFLIVTAVLSVFWSIHYNEYYLPDFVLAGWVGRITVYMISMATYLGTRRWSLAWVFYKISYEKTLKAHYVIGNVASIFMLVHGGMYMASFGPRNLPEHQVTTAYLLLGCILVVFPFTINNFRVHYYFFSRSPIS